MYQNKIFSLILIVLLPCCKFNLCNLPRVYLILRVFATLDASPWITVTLAMIGKFEIAASFAVIYVYAGELMPTVVRSEAMGISSFVAGIGLLIFPYINSLV